MLTTLELESLALPSAAVPKGDFGAWSSVYKFGFNPAVGTGEETVWEQGGLYAHPAAASVMTVSSGDANDDAAGTGAQTVQIYGLDGDYLEIDETVILDGQTAVSTTNSFLRVNRAIVRAAGSGAKNAGVIYVGTGTVTAGVPANIFTTIAAGENQTLQAFYTVPANYTAYLARVFASSFGNASANATVRVKVRPNGEVFQTKDKLLVTAGAVAPPRFYGSEIPARADIEVTAQSSVGSIDVSGAFELVMKQAA